MVTTGLQQGYSRDTAGKQQGNRNVTAGKQKVYSRETARLQQGNNRVTAWKTRKTRKTILDYLLTIVDPC